jgi:cold shock CspA family protein
VEEDLRVFLHVGFFNANRGINRTRCNFGGELMMRTIEAPSRSPLLESDADTASEDRWSNDGGQASTRVRPPEANTPILARGVIRQLIHLSAGTDIRSTHLVATHNGVGYGYIGTPSGDVYFDASAMTSIRFDQLTRNMRVEFVLDQGPYLRTSHVSIVADGAAALDSGI